MKRKIAIAMLVVAGLLAARSASADNTAQAHFELAQYTAPPVPVMDMCNVNGVNYPVDYSYRIWGTNVAGVWVVIGSIRITPTGPVAIGFGQAYPAICN
jgi:hypothetical protein